ncbi:MAG: hypothetical protein M1833_006248 [Piccolia ochrophora]|nr:MAG: hypothetical protein M1833_006248 [Piccolia ochrophora]
MAKDKAINPAQAQRKADKQKALKKGKAEQAARRNEKLGRRNPDRLQRQIDDFRSAEASGHALNARDKKQLEELERDVKAVHKAREALGDKAPQFGRGSSRGDGAQSRGGGRGRGGALGKRRREETGRDGDGSDSDSSTTESVRNIPMPRDTPPPIPPEFLRPGRDRSNPNLEPLPAGGPRMPHALPEKPETPSVPVQTVYEAKPVVRDLRKEAVSAFVPAAVRSKLEASRGQGKLLEPEEKDKLEAEGYGGVGGGKGDAGGGGEAPDVDAFNALEEEERRFQRELRGVEMEEVEDAGD